jgi:hypothetical protein
MEKLDELKIVKEYLLDEIHKIIKEGEKEVEKARSGKVSGYVINIISTKFTDRENHLRHLLDEILEEINEMNNKIFAHTTKENEFCECESHGRTMRLGSTGICLRCGNEYFKNNQ